MKNLVMILSMLMLVTSACNKISFQDVGLQQNKMTSVEDIPPVDHVDPIVEPPVEELPLRKAGVCVDQENVASCLTCSNPALPPPPPTVSTKAQKLAKIMAMSCQIYNRSYPADYVAPTEQEIRNHLLACTPDLYPETSTTAEQETTIQRLLDETDDSLRQRMFKGLWFQPPYTGHFETYFGLDGSEAAYVFCMATTTTLSPTLYTTEKAMAERHPGTYEAWLMDPAAQARYQAAQVLRSQLRSCLNKPGQPWSTPSPAPVPSAKKCDTKSFEGKYEKGGREEIQGLLLEGYKVAIEGNNMCSQVSYVPATGDYSGKVKIVGYRCK